MTALYTPWGEQLDRTCPLPEYPRPQLRRDSYLCLNGLWDYTVEDGDEYSRRRSGKVLVPFSPESLLSGCDFRLQSGETLWYERTFTLPEGFRRDRVLLHFGAVDQCCRVLVNDRPVGGHEGGYLPFTLDITGALVPGENRLTVAVTDDPEGGVHAFGKQRTDRGGIWYTPQSGIWQTVWMEIVPVNYIEQIFYHTDYDQGLVHLKVLTQHSAPVECVISGKDMEPVCINGMTNSELIVSLPDFHPWSPEDPFLYLVSLKSGVDRVSSYFAMRKCDIQTAPDGTQRFFLNNKPYFQAGVLDQGYWPESLYTAPTDEALTADISRMKKLGFNMLRKHAKIEPERFYYHCDQLGMLVWQDMVNGGSAYKHWFVTYLATLMNWNHISFSDDEKHAGLLSRLNPEGKDEFRREITETIAFLYNHPSIVVWVPFNEGWGQFDALAACEQIRTLDSSRLVDHASGLFDQKGGDILSLHYYFLKLKFKPESKRAAALTEFGGYSLSIPGHSCCKKVYGYKKFNSTGTLTYGYIDLIRQTILPAVKKGIGATVYTQLSDIEEETNGIYTYDREICKIDPDTLRKWNRALKEAGECKTYADHTTDH